MAGPDKHPSPWGGVGAGGGTAQMVIFKASHHQVNGPRPNVSHFHLLLLLLFFLPRSERFSRGGELQVVKVNVLPCFQACQLTSIHSPYSSSLC